MLTTILFVLKMIGIVLLWILAVIVLLILLIAFWPYFYRIRLNNEEELKGNIVLSWFFHILIIEVSYQNEFNMRMKLFGLPIYDRNRKIRNEENKAKKEKESKKKSKKALKRQKDDEESFELIENNKEMKIPDIENKPQETIEIKKDAATENKAETKNETETESAFHQVRTKSISEKIQDVFQKIKQIITKLIDWFLHLPEKIEELSTKLESKLDTLIETIDYYERLFSKKGTTWVIEFCKKEIGLLLRHMKPYYSKIRIEYGCDDPDTLAKIMEYYGMATPWLPKKTQLITHYDNSGLVIDALIKGRFYLFYVLFHGGRLLLNKKVKKFIKLLKREEA